MNAPARTLHVILTHQPPRAVAAMLAWWEKIAPRESLLVAFGGSRSDFDALAHEPRVFIDDPRLKTRDHQRELQSYSGVFRTVAEWLRGRDFTHVLVCEFDHLPLVADLDARLLARLEREQADVLGCQVRRVDDTNHPHYLYHHSNADFHRFWEKITRRTEPEVVLSMFGSGSFWRRAAFEGVAAVAEPFRIYLELWLPTLAHHLGFRVRDLPDQDPYVKVAPELDDCVEELQRTDAWAIHPVKHRWLRGH